MRQARADRRRFDELIEFTGFRVDPPRLEVPAGAVGSGLDGSDPLADQVRVLLEQHINPGIASHGGRAELVGIKDDDRVARQAEIVNELVAALELRSRAVDAAPQFDIQNHSAADASAECQTHNSAVSAPRTLPHLTERCCISVVFDQNPAL